MTGTEDLVALGRLLVAFPGADVVEGATLGTAAVSLAASGLAVFPLAPRSKVPHRGSNGLLDATTDVAQTAHRWTEQPASNIGAAVPAGAFVLDIDPRHDGHTSLRRLTDEHGPLPATLRARTGGKDGGAHLWWRHPGGKLRVPRDLPGIDLRIHTNYVVVDPSVHPDGGHYGWVDPTIPIADPPGWLIDRLRPPVVAHQPKPAWPVSPMVDSPADWFCASHTWWDVLQPHGWQALNPEGTKWKHPTATSSLSATVTNDCLFIFSTSTQFEPTGAGAPRGATKFRAFALLEHGGDLSAAARAARQLRQGQAA